ncbi:MAG: Hsp20/alpha crystallin family protein [Thermoprotei archaeon]|nr:MAG: Hsp20/alpha crystallin family protein [Thermoprotei archaeon]
MFDEWRGSRRRRRWWFDIFDELEREFERMEEMMERIFERSFAKVPGGKEQGPFVYGFSVTIGPDGKPVVREFGNVRPTPRGPIIQEETEPLVDVMDEGDYIKVYAELPGVNKEDIKLNASEDELIISVDTEQRKYYKEVKLPARVKPDTAKATYRNGVLEVKLEKEEKGKERGTRIVVE